MPYTRFLSSLLALFCLALCTLVTSCGSESAQSSNVTPVAQETQSTVAVVPTPEYNPNLPTGAAKAEIMLQEGNLRYVTGSNHCYNRINDRPLELNSIQHPIAVIVGCSDSRVDPQLAFDQPWGQLFMCRLAGNVVDSNVLGSTEYAVAALQTKLIVVLGHENCGAVDAAVKGKQLGGELQQLIDMIQPAVAVARTQPGNLLDNAIIANVRQSMAVIGNDTVIANGVQTGGVKIVGAVYSFDDGVVTWLP